MKIFCNFSVILLIKKFLFFASKIQYAQETALLQLQYSSTHKHWIESLINDVDNTNNKNPSNSTSQNDEYFKEKSETEIEKEKTQKMMYLFIFKIYIDVHFKFTESLVINDLLHLSHLFSDKCPSVLTCVTRRFHH